jgi:hypothetical protein
VTGDPQIDVASWNAVARECADLRDQLAQTVEELTAAREDAAHQFTQRCVETVRAEDAAVVVRTARNLIDGGTGPGHTNRRWELSDAIEAYDSRSLLVDADLDGAGMRQLAAVLLAHAARLDAVPAPADLDVDERRAAILAAGSDALTAAHRELRAAGVAPVDPPGGLGAETGAQGQLEGDAR